MGFTGLARKEASYKPDSGFRLSIYLLFKNRWVRATIWLIASVSTVLLYANWQPFSLMLVRDGAYSWKCTAEELSSSEMAAGKEFCEAQKTSISTLYSVAQASEFVMGIVAGVCLDYIGPLMTALVGFSFLFLGWMCMIYSSRDLVLYVPGMMFQGGAVNMISFPALVLGDLFPTKSGLAVSLVVAAQTTSTIVPMILDEILKANSALSFRSIIWSYLGFVFLPSSILMVATLPLKRVPNSKKSDYSVAMHDQSLLDADIKKVSSNSTVILPIEEKVYLESHLSESGSKSGYIIHKNTMSDSAPKIAETAIGISVNSVNVPSLMKQVLTQEYLLFASCYVTQVLVYTFYPKFTSKYSGSSVSQFQGYFIVFQGLFGLLFGLFVDKVGTLKIFISLTFLMAITYILALAPSVAALQYIGTCIFVITSAYFYTVKYTYMLEIFPPMHFGILNGLISALSGLFVLFDIFIQELPFRPVCAAYIISGLGVLVTLAYLRIRQKKGITYKGDATPIKDESVVKINTKLHLSGIE